MKIYHLMLAVLVAALSACSGAPSESTMASQIQSMVNSKIGTEFVKVDNLKKVNGMLDGGKYIADLAYDVTFTKGVDQVVQELMQKSGKNEFNTGGIGLQLMRNQLTMGLQSMLGNFKAGDIKHMKDKVKFAKSENGWVLIQ